MNTITKEYLSKPFQGRDSFLENIIFPIFSESKFQDAGDIDVLEDFEELRALANRLGIESVIKYGEIKVPQCPIAIYEIVVTDKVQMERNRVGISQFVRHSGLLPSFHGAFMIFHYGNDEVWDWRFSFCRKGASDLTEAKRYTFLLGPKQSCRTAAQNFNKLLEKESNITIEDIIGAFDVESLSNEFFSEYKAHYLAFVKHITGCDIVGGIEVKDPNYTNDESLYKAFGYDNKAVRDYVKRMLGRIVFLHFLQKKGWLGIPEKGCWGDGDPQFMYNLFEKASPEQQDNFLDEVLEPLFADALDKERTEQNDLYDTRVDAMPYGRVCKIPYLNGGLFTRDKWDSFHTNFPRKFFADLFTFFSHYNFTIDENDPSDAQVGVDPEMLGRIFENLLEDNKDKGAYYTPKEIVRYMCRQSISTYLKAGFPPESHSEIEQFTKTHQADALITIKHDDLVQRLCVVKVCDPAIGSGAFPMGILKEIFFCRTALEPETDVAEIKKEIIQRNIYGVDIEAGAVDIARLRFWLALIVDEQTPHTLPNLDFKIMQGNSLLEQYATVDLSKILNTALIFSQAKQDKSKVVEPARDLFGCIEQQEISMQQFYCDIPEIELLHNKTKVYFAEKDNKKKRNLRQEIDSLILSQIKFNLALRIEAITTTLEQAKQDANRRIATKSQKRMNAYKEELKLLNQKMATLDEIGCFNDQFFLWNTWFSDVLCNGEGGFDIVIGNPPYISAPAQVNNKILNTQRQEIIASNRYKSLYQKWDLYIPFLELGMQMIKENGVMTMIVPYPLTNQLYAQKLREMMLSDYNLIEIADLSGTKIFDNATVSNCIPFVQKSKHNDVIRISHVHEDNRNHICEDYIKTTEELIQNDKGVWDLTAPQEHKQSVVPNTDDMPILGDICYISKGMVLNADENTAKGEFKKDDLISDSQDDTHPRKYIEAKDIEPYRVKRYRYLEWDTQRCPDQLSRPTFRELYDQPKLIINCLGGLNVSYDEEQFLHNHSLYCAVRWNDLAHVQNKSIAASVKRYARLDRFKMNELSLRFDLRYILGILNSHLAVALLDEQRGGDYHIYPEHIRQIPIANVTMERQKEIANLAQQVLDMKSCDASADVSNILQQIDILVYKAYNMAYEQILSVDPETNITRTEYDNYELNYCNL
jgi:hypothetical protein